jgi:ubiquinol-cytochrome c reductase iron-sulfur subunit
LFRNSVKLNLIIDIFMSENKEIPENEPENQSCPVGNDPSRRDFLLMAAGAMGAVGAGAVAIPFVHSMNPSADVLALSSIEVDLSAIKEGDSITVKWRGSPVFIKRRTEAEIEAAKKVEMSELKDPESDDKRVQSGKEQWLVVLGVCTHLGCVPIGGQGEFGGWFCPCHGSQYDTSGRIRKGPAPTNLPVPQYSFITDTKIKIG